jgi:hypothetical protein
MSVALPVNVQPWLKYTATTVGRDKIYRAVQYFSRFLAWYLLRQGATKETVARFNSLKKTLGLSRKCRSLYIIIAMVTRPLSTFQACKNDIGGAMDQPDQERVSGATSVVLI